MVVLFDRRSKIEVGQATYIRGHSSALAKHAWSWHGATTLRPALDFRSACQGRTTDDRRPKKSAAPRAALQVAKPPVSTATARRLAASMSGAPELPVMVAPFAHATCV